MVFQQVFGDKLLVQLRYYLLGIFEVFGFEHFFVHNLVAGGELQAIFELSVEFHFSEIDLGQYLVHLSFTINSSLLPLPRNLSPVLPALENIKYFVALGGQVIVAAVGVGDVVVAAPLQLRLHNHTTLLRAIIFKAVLISYEDISIIVILLKLMLLNKYMIGVF